MKRLFLFSLINLLFLLSCKSDLVNIADEKKEIFTNLRMEVHVVDSIYTIYSKPHTKTYLYTYVLTAINNKTNEEYTDTTTCGNGWAVKELSHVLSKGDIIYLGATIHNRPDGKYQFETVTYEEILNLSGLKDTVDFIKTFTIYQ